MEGHPVKAVKDWKGRCCPLSLHGDEVPVQGVGKIWCRSALMISWASLIAIACGKGVSDCQIYIYGLFEKFIQSEAPGIPGTMSVLWQILQWSFQCIWDGTFPARDWRGIPFPRESPEWKKAGQRLAGKYFGCLVQLCGDLDYYAKWLGVPHYGSHSAPCSQCRCTYRGALSWLDCRSNSPWQRNWLSPSTWKEHWNTTCQLFQLPGVSGLSIAMDLMHCLHLGWLQYAYASVFSLIVSDCLTGTPLENLLVINKFVKDFQRQRPTKHRFRPNLNKLTMYQKKLIS